MFFKSKKQEFLALDIGSSAVKGLLFSKEQGRITANKIYSQKIQRFGIFQTKNFQVDVIKQAIQKLLQGLDVADRAGKLETIVSLPASILKAGVVEIVMKRQKPDERISKTEEKELRKLITQSAERRISDFITKSFGSSGGRTRIIREIVLEKKISGYKVKTLLGMRGSDLSFKILVVFGFGSHLDFMENILKVFHIDDCRITHEVEGLINFKKKTKNNQRVFVDIGQLYSQIFMFNDTLEAVGSFNVAGNVFSKKIKEQFKLTESETESLKDLFSRGKLSENVSIKLATALAPVYNLWLGSFQEELKRKMRGLNISVGKAVFFGGGSMMYALQNTLESSKLKSAKLSQGIDSESFKIQDIGIDNKTGIKFSVKNIPVLLLTQVNHFY